MRTRFFEAERDIGKLKETSAIGNSSGTVFPRAFAGRPFQAIAWGDPQVICPVILIDVFWFLSHSGTKTSRVGLCRLGGSLA